jgi:hypothetical protein
MAKQILTSEGAPIKSVSCVIQFLRHISKKYNIILEAEYIDALLTEYTSKPLGKTHIIISNKNNQFFCCFLSDEEVLDIIKILLK